MRTGNAIPLAAYMPPGAIETLRRLLAKNKNLSPLWIK
jgi:hypothetical protein